MYRFSQLCADLDGTAKTDAKVRAMVGYFQDVPAEDAAWAVFFLTGQKLKRLISGRVLGDWALKACGLPEWLVIDAHAAVGDRAETIALLLDRGPNKSGAHADPLHRWMEKRILPLRGQPVESQEAQVGAWWAMLSHIEIFLLNKLLTGSFRIGVTTLDLVRALAIVADLPRSTISHRLASRCQPTADWYRQLLRAEGDEDDRARPYPFFLASALEQPPDELGPLDDWQAEWKWHGVRGQLIRRGGGIFLWIDGEELVTDRYPELVAMAEKLPDGVVLDGEILAWNDDGVMPFSVLQKRIGRSKVDTKSLEEAPVGFLAYDVLEHGGEDLRSVALVERRRRLKAIVDHVGKPLMVSPVVEAAAWHDLVRIRSESRGRRAEGLMLKRKASSYGAGRKRGDWWQWNADPLSLDAVLIYAQAGSGQRAHLLTDYTFAVWRGDELVPITKTNSGLADEEIAELDRWIKQHTVERFGPVRQVEPLHVFELAFEGISASTRHKSGFTLRSSKIARWCTDKTPADADRIEHVRTLLEA